MDEDTMRILNRGKERVARTMEEIQAEYARECLNLGNKIHHINILETQVKDLEFDVRMIKDALMNLSKESDDLKKEQACQLT